jgi:hypothetical protein
VIAAPCASYATSICASKFAFGAGTMTFMVWNFLKYL